jgi:hypothetical protein
VNPRSGRSGTTFAYLRVNVFSLARKAGKDDQISPFATLRQLVGVSAYSLRSNLTLVHFF